MDKKVEAVASKVEAVASGHHAHAAASLRLAKTVTLSLHNMVETIQNHVHT